MKKMLTALLAAAVAGALFIAAPLTAAPKGTENFNKSFATQAQDCGDGNELLIWAPAKLWPPNHKYYEDIHGLATSQSDGQIVLTTIGTHNQYVDGAEMNGSGNTTNDLTVTDDQAGVTPSDDDTQITAVESSSGQVQTDWAARAERSGRDLDGRAYSLYANAEFPDGGSCEVDVEFIVPHDMRPSNRGTQYDGVEQG
jgi:hypothetical protein